MARGKSPFTCLNSHLTFIFHILRSSLHMWLSHNILGISIICKEEVEMLLLVNIIIRRVKMMMRMSLKNEALIMMVEMMRRHLKRRTMLDSLDFNIFVLYFSFSFPLVVTTISRSSVVLFMSFSRLA
ncbi:hypothetical protein E2542_SST16590 [Spatholobus suberectus]|nr:hypothetical protein E2542_SST16590 [Spatholobus suberectus]